MIANIGPPQMHAVDFQGQATPQHRWKTWTTGARFKNAHKCGRRVCRHFCGNVKLIIELLEKLSNADAEECTCG
jgi:hypothetical protein